VTSRLRFGIIRRALWTTKWDFFSLFFKTDGEWTSIRETKADGDSGHRAEKVLQEGEVDGGGRCPQPHRERREWTSLLSFILRFNMSNESLLSALG